eukprot:5155732-Prymnesium_polylepis.1
MWVARRRTARTARVSCAGGVRKRAAVNTNGCGAGCWPCSSLRDSMHSRLRQGVGSRICTSVVPARYCCTGLG